jgi:hypothetical protein
VWRLAPGLAVVLAAAAAAGCGGKTVTETATVTVAAPREPSPPGERTYFGHIESLAREGTSYQLRFDPAWFLSGETANTAAAEDGAVEPGEPVPNDNYVLEEAHRLLRFQVPADAHVTVLTRHGTGQFGATPVTVAELAEIVHGTSRMKLFEPLDSGVWIRVRIDAVRAIDQQYRP